MGFIRAWTTLVGISFRRLLWSASTLMVLFPLAAGAMFLLRRDYDGLPDVELAFERFSNFTMFIFASFLVPVVALAHGTASIGGDREDRTLLFLLVRPIPRALILLAKFLATLPLVLGLVMGTYWLYCQLAGEVGQIAWPLYSPAVFYMALAYVGLFHLFAVVFRHSTIIALVYAVFMELMLGSMPGIIKRVAVNYYGRSLMYSSGLSQGLDPPDPRWFEPMATQTSQWALLGFAGIGMLVALAIFQRREYRDLA